MCCVRHSTTLTRQKQTAPASRDETGRRTEKLFNATYLSSIAMHAALDPSSYSRLPWRLSDHQSTDRDIDFHRLDYTTAAGGRSFDDRPCVWLVLLLNHDQSRFFGQGTLSRIIPQLSAGTRQQAARGSTSTYITCPSPSTQARKRGRAKIKEKLHVPNHHPGYLHQIYVGRYVKVLDFSSTP